MSHMPWNLVRDVELPLGSADPLLEATQTYGGPYQGQPLIAIPPVRLTDSGHPVREIELVAHGFQGTTPKTGTLTLQFIEIAPTDDAGTGLFPDDLMFIGRAPVSSHPTGRGLIVEAHYLYAFTVLVSSVSITDADRLQIRWRTYR